MLAYLLLLLLFPVLSSSLALALPPAPPMRLAPPPILVPGPPPPSSQLFDLPPPPPESSAHQPQEAYVSLAPLSSDDDGRCDLRCWLGRLTVHIPDQKFSRFGVVGTMENAVCTGAALGDLRSALVRPTGINMTASQLSIQCSLGWTLDAGIITASGTAAAVVNNSMLAVQMELMKDPTDGLANSAELTRCDVSIVVSSVVFQGDLSGFLNFFRSSISSIISSQLNSLICNELGTLVHTNLTNVLQEVNEIIRPFLKPRPPAVPPAVPPGMVNLINNPLLAVVDYVLDDLVGATGPFNLNRIVNKLTNDTGALSVSDVTLSMPITIPSLGVVTIGLINASLAGLNTWEVFDVLEPAGSYNLSSYTLLNNFALSVAVSINVTVNSSLGDTYLYEEAVLEAELQNNSLRSSLQVAIREATVLALSDTEKIVPGCLMSTLYDLNLTQLDFSFVLSQIEILAVNGGSEEQIDAAINNMLALFTTSFQVAIPALFNGIIAGPARVSINSGFEAIIEANHTCTDPGRPATFNEETTTVSFSVVGCVVAVLLLAGVIFLFVTKFRAMKPDREDDENSKEPLMSNTGLINGPTTDAVQACDTDQVACNKKWFSGLIFCPRFHFLLRYGIFITLLLNIAMFISSNTSVGAAVYLYVNMGGQETKLPSLFDFSLANSVIDMWEAKVYALALLIAVFSGAWPYTKLILLLFCWVVPLKILSRRKREWLLMAIDALGKWSLIDAFVLTLMMIAFHFHIVPPVTDRTPEGTVSVDAFVEPHWGFYSFLIATMMSLAATHIVLACHRKETKESAQAKPNRVRIEDTKWEALHTHAFKSSKFLSRYTWAVNIFIVSLVIMSIALLISGSIIESFQFQFKGAFQLLLEFLDQPAITSYSLISTGVALPDSAWHPNSIGIRYIQATWFCFAIAIPLCYMLLLLILWLTPMTAKLQRTVFVITEVFNAWSALDVVVVSIIAALLELQQFSQFIIGDRCDLINPIIKQLFNQELNGDAKCFDVVATLDQGCWLLFTSCIIYIMVGLVVQLTCHKALKEREGMLALDVDEDTSDSDNLANGTNDAH